MYLSDILSRIDSEKKHELINERSFEALGLAHHHPGLEMACFVENEKYISKLSDDVVMVITKPELAFLIKERGVCIAATPRLLFFKIHNYLSISKTYTYQREKHKTTIGRGCKISPIASVASNNVIIGDNVIIEEFVVVRENTKIGDNSIIRSGSVVGGVGFEFKRNKDMIMAVEHCGGVIIGDFVEIQHNVCIDRAIYPWDDTEIGNYTKIDNLVQIAHAAKIGSCVLIAASAVVAGRTIIEDNSWIGVSATLSNGLNIGSNVDVAIGSVALKNIKKNQRVFGNPAKVFDEK